jgi:hypothetical protein
MPNNPYQYVGPLDPQDPNLVCNHRVEDINRVIQGILRGDYWTILGSRQVGKTTFLNLVKHLFKQAYCIYFDFEVVHENEKEFYQELVKKILEKIPHKRTKLKTITGDSPAMSFFGFLINFKPQEEKKIILLFDEIDGLPFLTSFLHFWRKVYHERNEEKELTRYTVVTTGSVELVKLVIGYNSPFNIAKALYIKDFSEEESKEIIEKPFAKLGIRIETKAKQELLIQISGHPQLLQHACHILVEKAKELKGAITENHFDEAIGILLRENSIIETLKRDIVKVEALKNLVHDLLIEKKQKIFYPYKEYSLLGAGAIKEQDSYCAIRNEVYKTCIMNLLDSSSNEKKKEFITARQKSPTSKTLVFISYSHKDEKWKDRFEDHLGVLEKQGTLLRWCDDKIRPGDDWRLRIKEAIDRADLAILLISKNFLRSEFILEEEVPILLERQKQGMPLFPILLSHCAWQAVEWLEKMQIRPKGAVPIGKWTRKEKQDQIISEIVNEIYGILKKSGSEN